ncbi:MAG: hypothetical protein J0I92_04645 [Phyllobacterium sp.]|nr:hypothetical protein [Phyllobacterium sp.]ODT32035.1 MAG: hypothetical protein ABS35_03110 [Kaistia sp. SCN 65-12]
MTDDRAQRFGELDEAVQELLSRMKPEHVETLEYLSTLPKDEVRGLMKMFRDIKAVSKFLRWAIATLVAIFIGALLSARTSPRLWGG